MTKDTQEAIVLVPRYNKLIENPFSPSFLPPLSQPNTLFESNKDWFTQHLPANHRQRRALAVASVAIASVTTGSLATLISQTPEYEGKFQLVVKPAVPEAPIPPIPSLQGAPETTEDIFGRQQSVSNPAPIPSAAPVQSLDDVQHQEVNATDADSMLISETHAYALQSRRLIDPAIKQLQAQHVDIDYQSLIQNLTVTINANQQFEIAYRDPDPEKVQLVLAALAQSYIDYSHECNFGACRGVEFIEARLPALQQKVADIRDRMQQFQQQHGLTNVQAQTRLVAVRSVEIAKQSAILTGELAEVRTHYATLQERMALKPNEAIAPNLLQQDPRYQTLLLQFRATESQIAKEFSRLDGNASHLQMLYARHQSLLAQLQQETQQVLRRYLADPNANLQNPIFQEPIYLELLQQSINTAHHIQVLETRQQTVTQVDLQLAQQRSQLAKLLKQRGYLQNELHSATEILQEYFNRRETLKAQVAQESVSWQLVNSPQMTTNEAGEPVVTIPDLQRNVGIAAGIGVLLGIGIVSILERRKAKTTSTLSEPISVTAEQLEPVYLDLYPYEPPQVVDAYATFTQLLQSTVAKKSLPVSVSTSA